MADAVPRRTGRNGRSPRYAERPSSSSRGYGGEYRKARELKVAHNPLCEVCESRGKVVPMAETHHVEPTAKRLDLAASVANLVSVCKECHCEIEGLDWAELGKRYGIKPMELFTW